MQATKSKEKISLLSSGGLDSTVLLYKLLLEYEDIQLIYINYGQHFKETELSSLQKVAPNDLFRNIKIIDISSVYSASKSPLLQPVDLWKTQVNDSDLYIPYRTLVMISVGIAYSQSIGCTQMYAGFIDSNYVNDIDCSEEFLGKLDSLNKIYRGVELNFPFKHMSKADVANLGININAPIFLTYSCQINDKVPCGACANCVDRDKSFNEVNSKIDLMYSKRDVES
jgi:7-cyano-7-deazaguanine synthase